MASQRGNEIPSAPNSAPDYGHPPPPYGQPPPPYGQPSSANTKKPGSGGQDDFVSKLTYLGKGVGNVLLGVTKAGVNMVSKALQPLSKDWMRTGSVIQLIAKTSGRALQILQAPDGRLVLDGLGGEGTPYFNAHFTVICPEPGVITLHNNFNYICIDGGITQIHQAGPVGVSSNKCRFRVREAILGGQFFIFESDSERGRFLSVMQNGMIKSALVTRFEDTESQLAIRVIYGAPPGAH